MYSIVGSEPCRCRSSVFFLDSSSAKRWPNRSEISAGWHVPRHARLAPHSYTSSVMPRCAAGQKITQHPPHFWVPRNALHGRGRVLHGNETHKYGRLPGSLRPRRPAEPLHELLLLQLHSSPGPQCVWNCLAVEVRSLWPCRPAELLHLVWLFQLHGGQCPQDDRDSPAIEVSNFLHSYW